MKRLTNLHIIKIGFISAAVLVLANPAMTSAAITYNFQGITNNNPRDVAIGARQLSVDVSDAGRGRVLFNFLNVGRQDCSITQIYFDDDASLLTGFAERPYSPDRGVSFSVNARAPNLPGGRSLDNKFIADYSLGANSPVQPNGINPGESLFVTLGYRRDANFRAIIRAINTNQLRIGIHVQGYESGGSESYIVPEPTSIMLTSLGTLLVGVVKRRKKA